jgi:hypothetical protein
MHIIKFNLWSVFVLFILFALCSCDEKTNRKQQTVKTIIKEKIITDTPSEPFVNDHPVLHPDSIGLFSLNEDRGPKDDTLLFVSISDVSSLSKNEDSNIISNLKGKKAKEKRHFVLTPKYRKRLLINAHISETDSLFVYDYAKDVLLSFPINSLTTIACLNPYSDASDGPYPDYYYMLGFKIDPNELKSLSNNYFTTTYVAIGSTNPFNRGQMRLIVWKKINPEKFPLVSLRVEELRELKGAKLIGTYTFKTDSYKFYLQQYSKKDENWPSELLIITNADNKIIFNDMYYKSEGEAPAPLSFVNNKKNLYEQWVGHLLQNRPPLLLGFEYFDFACPPLPYIEQSRGFISSYCDCRH